MDDEEVGWAVEGNDLALELLPQGSLCGDHHAYRELLAAGLHAAAGAAARWSDGWRRRGGAWGFGEFGEKLLLRVTRDNTSKKSWEAMKFYGLLETRWA
jgi:hypothetical protein